MADFRINVIVDPSRVNRGTKPVERGLTRIENRANQLRRTLGLTFGALAGGAVVFAAVRSMAKFEESLATAQAVTKATAAEFAQLRDRALELGVQTRFSATQAADALVLLARAGFSVDEALTAVGDTLLLAQAGGLGLAEAADITASALRGFNLEADQTKRVTDVLVETSNNANTNVSQLGQALKFVAPIAAGLNQSLERTSAALGVLSDAGLKATLAGTGLRRVFAELESPGKELKRLLNEASIAADEVAPSTNQLVDILTKLKTAGVDAGGALEIFGQRGGPAFQVLVSNIPKLERLNGQIDKSKDAAKDVAEIMDQTLFGALKRAASALEGLVLAFGQAGASDFLVLTLDTISEAVRFLAKNIEIIQVVLLTLAGTAVAKLAQSLFLALLPALKAVASGTLRTTIVVNALTASTLAARAAALLLSATFLPLVAAFAVVARLAEELKDSVEGVAEANQALEDDAGFAVLGQQIRVAREELKRLEKIKVLQGFLSQGQQERAEVLAAGITATEKAIRGQADAQAELNEREKRGAENVDNLITRLERRNEIEKALGQTAKDRVQFEGELQKLLNLKSLPTSNEKDRIRALIEENDVLARQRKIFEEIKGPQEEFIRDQAALKELFDRNKISAEEFTVKLQELQDAQGDTGFDPDDLNSLQQLQDEVSLLDQRLRLGDEQVKQEEILNQLIRDNVDVTDEMQDQIAKLVPLHAQLTEQIRARNEAEKQADRDAKKEERAIERLSQRLDLGKQEIEQEKLLQAARDANKITTEQHAQALADLQLKGLEASFALEDGFSRAFAKIEREANDLAAVGEKVVNVFADRATDALVEFATTGRFVFKEFATAILQDLIKIIARLLIVQALNSAFGGGVGTVAGAGASLAAGGGGGRQDGGTVQPNTSFTVGENGPELFVPGRTGTIVPNQKDQAPAPAPVIQVVNVQSEDQIPEVIASGAATDAIINELGTNRDSVKQALGLA